MESLTSVSLPMKTTKRIIKLVLNIHWKNWCWNWNSKTFATDAKNWLIWKYPDAGKDWGQEEKGTNEDEMAGWHHWLNGHGFGWTLGVGDGQGGLVYCGSWSRKEWDTTEWLNWTELKCWEAFCADCRSWTFLRNGNSEFNFSKSLFIWPLCVLDSAHRIFDR